jgi:hypothetical protein
MLSILSKSFERRVRESLDLQINHNKIMVKVTLTSRIKDKTSIINPRKTSASHIQRRRIMGNQRKTLESGVRSTKTLGTTLTNVVPNNHYWWR